MGSILVLPISRSIHLSDLMRGFSGLGSGHTLDNYPLQSFREAIVNNDTSVIVCDPALHANNAYMCFRHGNKVTCPRLGNIVSLPGAIKRSAQLSSYVHGVHGSPVSETNASPVSTLR